MYTRYVPLLTWIVFRIDCIFFLTSYAAFEACFDITERARDFVNRKLVFFRLVVTTYHKRFGSRFLFFFFFNSLGFFKLKSICFHWRGRGIISNRSTQLRFTGRLTKPPSSPTERPSTFFSRLETFRYRSWFSIVSAAGGGRGSTAAATDKLCFAILQNDFLNLKKICKRY
jgi:hypothetical protein